MLAAHDAILALDFDTYVGGHVYRTGSPADVQQSRDFFVDMVTTTKQKIGEVSFADAAALGEPANAWAAQTVWMRRIAEAVTTELVERWSDQLAAVDTFTPETVGGLIVSISTDALIKYP
jgi:hypothetical protein